LILEIIKHRQKQNCNRSVYTDKVVF